MSEHTPGPWTAERRNWNGEESPHRIYISGDEHDSREDDDHGGSDCVRVATAVCVVEGNATSGRVTAANARLISAAPELLVALADMVAWADRHGLTLAKLINGSVAELPVIANARAALAKARTTDA